MPLLLDPWFLALSLIAAGWLAVAVPMAAGMRRVPRLPDVEAPPDAALPELSVIVPAKDEAASLPRSLPKLLAQDYPGLEIIAVDDRSADATGALLDGYACSDPRLRVLHIGALPEGWLGKPHALFTGYAQARSEWVLFTDADIEYAPDALRRAVWLALANDWEYLTVMPRARLEGFWERTILTYWGLGFVLTFRPWRVADPRSRAGIGMGAFQLFRRDAYERTGTHRRLALEVVEDVVLGQIAKGEGLRCGVALGENLVLLRWFPGLRQLLGGFTKNFFAVHGYSVPRLAARTVAGFAFSVLPFLALAFASGPRRLAAGAAALIAVAIHAIAARGGSVSLLYGLTHPIAALIMIFMLLESMVVTLRQGGVRWRDTFYPLDTLRAARRKLQGSR